VNATAPVFTILDQQGNVTYGSGSGRTVIRLKCIEHITVLGPDPHPGIIFDSDLFPHFFTLTLDKAGTGSGTVTGTPPGIDRGSSCVKTCVCGKEVTLTATSNPDSMFLC